MNPLQDRIAIVTGAASGIGRALVEEMGRRGAVVIGADLNGEQAKLVAGGIEKAGGRASAAVLDVSDAEAVKRLVEDTVRQHGRLDYLFNNAGIGIASRVQDMDLEDWNRILDVNLRGVIHGVYAAYPVMLRQGSGHIVNTASLAGLTPFPAGRPTPRPSTRSWGSRSRFGPRRRPWG